MVFSARLAREQGLPTNRQGVHRGGGGDEAESAVRERGVQLGMDHPPVAWLTKDVVCDQLLTLAKQMSGSCFYDKYELAYETVAVALMEGFVQGIEGQDQGMDVGGTDFEVNCQATVSTVSCSPSCLVGQQCNEGVCQDHFVHVHSRTKHAACMTMIVLMNEGAALGTVVGQLFGRGEWGHGQINANNLFSP